MLAGLAVAVPGFASNAKADYIIRLDNYANPSDSISWSKTNNTVTVSVSTGDGGFTPIGSKVLNSRSGSHDFCYVGSLTYYAVDQIKVSINGDDIFWLDQIELFHSPPGTCRTSNRVWDKGTDNEQGWCFSTDWNDQYGNERWCEPDQFTSSFLWDVPPLP
jgi:hypothetical protein